MHFSLYNKLPQSTFKVCVTLFCKTWAFVRWNLHRHRIKSKQHHIYILHFTLFLLLFLWLHHKTHFECHERFQLQPGENAVPDSHKFHRKQEQHFQKFLFRTKNASRVFGYSRGNPTSSETELCLISEYLDMNLERCSRCIQQYDLYSIVRSKATSRVKEPQCQGGNWIPLTELSCTQNLRKKCCNSFLKFPGTFGSFIVFSLECYQLYTQQ